MNSTTGALHPGWYADCVSRVRALGAFVDDWDGSGARAPNPTAVSGALRWLEALNTADRQPDRVLADAEGGIAFYFFGQPTLPCGAHKRYALLIVSNDGSIVAMTEDRTSGSPDAWEVRLGDFTATIEHFAGFLDQ